MVRLCLIFPFISDNLHWSVRRKINNFAANCSYAVDREYPTQLSKRARVAPIEEATDASHSLTSTLRAAINVG